jgi:hypothetical protein
MSVSSVLARRSVVDPCELLLASPVSPEGDLSRPLAKTCSGGRLKAAWAPSSLRHTRGVVATAGVAALGLGGLDAVGLLPQPVDSRTRASSRCSSSATTDGILDALGATPRQATTPTESPTPYLTSERAVPAWRWRACRPQRRRLRPLLPPLAQLGGHGSWAWPRGTAAVAGSHTTERLSRNTGSRRSR